MPDLTPEDIEAKRVRNADAERELADANAKRIAAEQATERGALGAQLDADHERIQAAVAQANGLNAKAAEPVKAATAAAAAVSAADAAKNAAGASVPAAGEGK